eukprot:CAMPEP_0180413968 /NCGR_PEP_ID=MMETSP0989-20121125/45370_1 /TAXON_ID=697907 /ORGANISM="non described non described, Strain CCMP2293" /LENGTH=42 /DNA_ID= /DNA_START= /DNA_END= /DNA_ORIENTATION=
MKPGQASLAMLAGDRVEECAGGGERGEALHRAIEMAMRGARA